MSSRDAILGRVRKALQSRSPEPHWIHDKPKEGPNFPLPDPENEEHLRSRFLDEFKAIQGEPHLVGSVEEAAACFQDWVQSNEFSSLLALDSEPLRRILNAFNNVQWVQRDNSDRAGWENVDVGVTLAESLVAESGTIAVSSASAGRSLSVLPPTNLVVATADQLVPDLETSMRRLRDRYGDQLPTNMSWITGPSRTADIEKILVLGAHGPRRLALLLLPAGSLT